MRHLRPGNVGAWFLGGGIGDDRNSARGDRLVDKFVSVTRFTPHGDKQIARLDPARIVFQPANARVTTLNQHFRPIQEFKKIYKREFNRELNDDEAREVAERVMRVFDLIVRPLPSELQKADQETHTDKIDETTQIDTL